MAWSALVAERRRWRDIYDAVAAAVPHVEHLRRWYLTDALFRCGMSGRAALVWLRWASDRDILALRDMGPVTLAHVRADLPARPGAGWGPWVEHAAMTIGGA